MVKNPDQDSDDRQTKMVMPIPAIKIVRLSKCQVCPSTTEARDAALSQSPSVATQSPNNCDPTTL
jgi:hypothetical protein